MNRLPAAGYEEVIVKVFTINKLHSWCKTKSFFQLLYDRGPSSLAFLGDDCPEREFYFIREFRSIHHRVIGRKYGYPCWLDAKLESIVIFLPLVSPWWWLGRRRWCLHSARNPIRRKYQDRGPHKTVVIQTPAIWSYVSTLDILTK